MSLVTVLIPNYRAHEAVQLAIESVRARTAMKDYSITVLDNLAEGEDRPYLEKAEADGWIKLIRQDGINLRPGEAMSALLRTCDSKFAVHIESDIEVIAPDWIDVMLRLIRDEKTDVAVARFFPHGPHCNTWFAPVYGPECILLNMPLYRQIEEPHDWQQRSVMTEDYPHKELFANMRQPDGYNGTVNLDTGWRFSEKILWPIYADQAFKVQLLPTDFFQTKVIHYGGISTRGDRPEIQPRWAKVRERLAALRSANA